MSSAAAAVVQREAHISRIKWERPGNSWRLLSMDNGETWKGDAGETVYAGDFLKVDGHYETDKYGRALVIDRVNSHIPKSSEGIKSWLSDRLPNIGPERAQALLDAHGKSLFDVIETNPSALLAIKGITSERAQEISDAFQTYKVEGKVVSWLVDHGMRIGLAKRVFKHYRSDARRVLDSDPYECMDVDGVVFDVIDEVARKAGMSERDSRRMVGWARQQLENELERGHCFLPSAKLIGGLTKWGYSFKEASDILAASPRLSVRANAVQLANVSFAEHAIAAKITEMLKDAVVDLRDEAFELPASLDDSQRAAAHALLTSPVAVMTGGPGCGKTYTLTSVLSVLEAQGLRVALAAPTGKAAKRMTEVTGRQACTIHKLLGFMPEERDPKSKKLRGGWAHNETNPLEADVVVLDEASMIDVLLFSSLVQALGNARLLIVGDSNQLPPVGPGQPLYDLMRSGVVPTYCLTTVHRQAGDSWVIDNAAKIIAGKVPNTATTSDFDMVACADSSDIIDAVVGLYKAIPSVQVLTPEHLKGAGTIALNNAVQAAINPRSKFDMFAQCGDYRIYEGDKVLYTKNKSFKNEDNEVIATLVNGDMGIVMSISSHDDKLIVEVAFEGVEHPHHPEGFFELTGDSVYPLTLAYAMTVHKSQGSQWANIALIADETHSSLRRQLVYTAVTRTTKMLAIIGSEEALSVACQKPMDTGRRTLLVERLTAP